VVFGKLLCLTQTQRFFSVVFGSNTTEIVVLITNIILWRGEILNLAQTPQKNLKTHEANAE